MKILFLPSWYPINSDDYCGCFFRELAIALSENGVDVSVIAPIFFTYGRFLDFKKSDILGYENDNLVKTYRKKAFFRFPISSICNAIDWYLTSKDMLDSYIKLNGLPDIVHIQSSIYAGVISKYIEKKYKIPMVLTEHSSTLNRDKVDFFKKKLLNFTSRRMKSIFSVSNDFKEKLIVHNPDLRWKVIPNSVNPDFFNLEKRVDIKSCTTEFIHVSNLTENKNVILILQSFSEVLKLNKNVRLKIVGNGSTASYLKEYVTKNDMNEFVDFLGVLSRKRVKEEISKSDIFLLSSKKETFGVVVIEALALGIPVISTKSGGVNDTITPRDGRLSGFTVEDFSSAMLSMIENISSFDNIDISNRALIRYHPNSISKIYIKEYTEIANV